MLVVVMITVTDGGFWELVGADRGLLGACGGWLGLFGSSSGQHLVGNV